MTPNKPMASSGLPPAALTDLRALGLSPTLYAPWQPLPGSSAARWCSPPPGC